MATAEQARRYRAQHREEINARARAATAARKAAGIPAPVHIIQSRFPAANGRKRCQRCQVERGVALFNNNQRYSDRLCPYCAVCKRQKYERNSEHVKAKARVWHAENRDHVIARKRAHHAANRDEVNARRRAAAAAERALRPAPEPRPAGPHRTPPRFPAADGRKRCQRCKVLQPVEEFHNNQAYADLRCPYCKTCKKIKNRKYAPRAAARRRANLDHHAARQRAYRASLRVPQGDAVGA